MLISDDQRRLNIVAQTADLRHSVRSEGLRALLREKGYDPNKCLQLSCDQGDDVNITLALPDGTVVNADYHEHFQTRQAIRFTEWNVTDSSDRKSEFALRMISESKSPQFDSDVRRYFDEKLAATDRPLPPLQWGNRAWHHWEQPPGKDAT